MKNRHNDQMSSAPLPLDEFTARFPTVPNRAASAARVLLGAGNEHLVKEVVNDVLLQLWRRQRDGKLPNNPENWAYTVAWNRAARVARLQGRYVTGLVEQLDESKDNRVAQILMEPDEFTPVTSMELTERLMALNKLFGAFDLAAQSELTEREAQLFDLLYRKRLLGSEAAARLGLTPEAVRQQWSRLLTKLLNSVRLQLQKDPLCNELLVSVLNNEKVFRRTFVQFLRFAMKKGVQELEKLVKSSLKKNR